MSKTEKGIFTYENGGNKRTKIQRISLKQFFYGNSTTMVKHSTYTSTTKKKKMIEHNKQF